MKKLAVFFLFVFTMMASAGTNQIRTVYSDGTNFYIFSSNKVPIMVDVAITTIVSEDQPWADCSSHEIDHAITLTASNTYYSFSVAPDIQNTDTNFLIAATNNTVTINADGAGYDYEVSWAPSYCGSANVGYEGAVFVTTATYTNEQENLTFHGTIKTANTYVPGVAVGIISNMPAGAVVSCKFQSDVDNKTVTVRDSNLTVRRMGK